MKILISIFAILLVFAQSLDAQVLEDGNNDDEDSTQQVLVATQSTGNEDNENGQTNKPEIDPKIRGILDYLDKRNAQLLSTLHGLRIKADQGLIDLFPQFKSQIEALHDINNECYDQSIGVNRTIDIFKAKVHNIVEVFFSENQNLLKKFKPEEIPQRVKAFLGNLKNLAKLVLQCVKDKALGLATTTYGITPLSIYTLEEFGKTILNHNLLQNSNAQNSSSTDNQKPTTQSSVSVQNPTNKPDSTNSDLCNLKPGPNEATIPAKFNWNEQGYVSPVYNQEKCESCYVFSTTSALESQYMIKVKKEQVHLSVQATLNCMPYGCGGGNLEDPMKHFVKHGVTLDENAPYINSIQRCSKKNMTVHIKADHYCNFEKSLSDLEMQLMVLRNGPSAVAISVNPKDSEFQMLKGVWNRPCENKASKVNHAVLLVGWDENNWIIKNSWGPGWGIEGFLHMPRGENKCGVNSMLGVPIIYKRN